MGNQRIGAPHFARYSRNAQLVAGAFGDQSVRLGNAWPLEWRATPLLGHDATVPVLDFSPDDKVLASAGDDGAVNLWDTATNQLLQTFSTVPDPQSHHSQLRFSPDGSCLVYGASHNTRLKSEVIIWPVTRPENPVP